MRFIDRSDCTSVSCKGEDYDVVSLIGDDGDKLSEEACTIAEENGFGVLKLSHGRGYKIIKDSGLGSADFNDSFDSLDDIDAEFTKMNYRG